MFVVCLRTAAAFVITELVTIWLNRRVSGITKASRYLLHQILAEMLANYVASRPHLVIPGPLGDVFEMAAERLPRPVWFHQRRFMII